MVSAHTLPAMAICIGYLKKTVSVVIVYVARSRMMMRMRILPRVRESGLLKKVARTSVPALQQRTEGRDRQTQLRQAGAFARGRKVDIYRIRKKS